ncbi:hypothetical protein [Labrenzia sp. OB1]|uniref:hypothetical protein n=1 Tax=Labrenzia sp. OB1 TaxID=1561204 RepID=UPI0012E91C09|nr:hypothetical protein [Labrenzia sp. OB1]
MDLKIGEAIREILWISCPRQPSHKSLALHVVLKQGCRKKLSKDTLNLRPDLS